jgi:hypothetical protein
VRLVCVALACTMGLGALAVPASASVEGANSTHANSGQSAREVSAGGKLLRQNPDLFERAKREPGDNGSPLLTGILLDDAGKPVDRQLIRVDLEPSRALANAAADDVGVELVPLGETRTSPSGRFKLNVSDLGDLSGYQEPDGSVSLLVVASAAGSDLMRHIIARPPGRHGDAWTWEVPDDEVLEGAEPSGAPLETRGSPSQAKGKPIALRLQVKKDKSAGDIGPMMTDDQARTQCQNRYGGMYTNFAFARSGDFLQKTLNRVQRYYIKGGIAELSLRFADVSTTAQDAVANIGPSESMITVGYTRTMENRTAWNFPRPSNTQMDLRFEYDNMRYYLQCIDPINRQVRYPNVYEWRAQRWTTGSSYGTLNTPIFNCPSQYVTRFNGEMTVSRNTSLAFSAGTSVAGITARTTHTKTSSHTLFMKGTANGAWVCGNTGYVDTAQQVREQ